MRDPSDYDRDVMPVLIADTMATFRFANESELDIGAVLPATISRESKGKFSKVKLVRKLNLHGPFAWACAGDGNLIRTLAHEVRMQAPDWANLERPVRPLGKISDAIGVQTLCAYGSAKGINILRKYPEERIPYLGTCSAIGSGALDLMHEVRRAPDMLARFGPEATVRGRTLGFVNWLNCHRLAREITGEAGESWGGYLEYASFNGVGWDRGLKTVNLFFVMDVGDGVNTASVYPRVIAYDPGPDIGRILAISDIGSTEFQLENMSQSESDTFPALDWRNWRPQIATATLIVRDGKNFLYSAKTYGMKYIMFKRLDHGWQYGFEKQEYFEQFVQDFREEFIAREKRMGNI